MRRERCRVKHPFSWVRVLDVLDDFRGAQRRLFVLSLTVRSGGACDGRRRKDHLVHPSFTLRSSSTHGDGQGDLGRRTISRPTTRSGLQVGPPKDESHDVSLVPLLGVDPRSRTVTKSLTPHVRVVTSRSRPVLLFPKVKKEQIFDGFPSTPVGQPLRRPPPGPPDPPLRHWSEFRFVLPPPHKICDLLSVTLPSSFNYLCTDTFSSKSPLVSVSVSILFGKSSKIIGLFRRTLTKTVEPRCSTLFYWCGWVGRRGWGSTKVRTLTSGRLWNRV